MDMRQTLAGQRFGGKPNDKARKLPLVLVIDTTGNMGSIIDGVKSSATAIVDNRIASGKEPSTYILSPFNDPSTGHVAVTTDASGFKSQINALGASGGGDCPELSMQGEFAGISASPENADLFMWSDASSKDAYLGPQVEQAAKAKHIIINHALFGSCYPIDPAIIRLSVATGGQAFLLDSTESGKVVQFADLKSKFGA